MSQELDFSKPQKLAPAYRLASFAREALGSSEPNEQQQQLEWEIRRMGFPQSIPLTHPKILEHLALVNRIEVDTANAKSPRPVLEPDH